MSALAPRVVVPAGATLGESPVWDERTGLLYWVDIKEGRLHVHDPAGAADRSIEVGDELGATALRRDGGVLLALPSVVAGLDADLGNRTDIGVISGLLEGERLNDGVCDPAGRFWVGTTVGPDRPGLGSLRRVDPDGTVETVLEGVTISNGLDFTEDGATLYYVDTPTRRIDAFDVDVQAGTLSNRRTVVSIPDGQGNPDGLTLDAEGGLWVALWDGHAVHRYDSAGLLTEVVEFPVQRPTCPVFGGPDLGTLYVTSASIGTTDELGGAIFTLEPGVTGRPAYRFGG